MIEANRNDYINYRLEKSTESFETAILLTENQRWNAAINRLYYASFYAVSAILINSNLVAKSHSGTKSHFFLHFIKPGDINKDMGKLYSDLFDWRQKGDYGDFFDFQEVDVLPLIKPTKKLLNKIHSLISASD